jgi:glycosyltransferase involved in cell wall biosynthesis
MNKTIAIFGPYPPPLGGISVHIQRMEPFLNKEKIDYKIFNHGFTENENVIATNKKLFWYLKLLFVKKYNTFHFHQFFLFHFVFYFVFSIVRTEKIIVTIHSERILSYNSLKRKLILFFIKKTKRLTLISVSQNLNSYLIEQGLRSIFLPAYVPPSEVKEIKLECTKKMILFSVWKFDEKLANEIYNVPIAFEYLSRNRANYDMLFMVGNKLGSDESYLQKLINKYGIVNNIKIIYDQNLVNYLNNCALLLRPNLSDGYGVSIQEALDLGVPAVASDVCKRPKGAILFKNNNLEDLSKKIEFVSNLPLESILKEKEELDYHLQLIEIYKAHL